jgi:hypothetical protein
MRRLTCGVGAWVSMVSLPGGSCRSLPLLASTLCMAWYVVGSLGFKVVQRSLAMLLQRCQQVWTLRSAAATCLASQCVSSIYCLAQAYCFMFFHTCSLLRYPAQLS